ncbi:hypothetical protein, partial [Sporisorium scitamineum]
RPPSAAPTPSLQPATAPQSSSITQPITTSPTSAQLPTNLAAPSSAVTPGANPAINGAMPSGLNAVDSMTGAPGPNPQLQSHFHSGSAVLRLLQYSEGLGAGNNRTDIDYWRSFVNEFFIPTGVFRLILWNATSREQKGFEVPTYVLPRYLLTNYVSGLRSSQLQLENPREYHTGWPPVNPLPPPPSSHKYLNSLPSPNVTHQVEVSKATFLSSFESGWQVQMTGLLRACFVPWAVPHPGEPAKMDVQLRLESLDFTVHAHTGYIPRVAIQKSKVEHPLPNSLVANILSTGDTNASSQNGSKRAQSRGGAAGGRKDEADDAKRDEDGEPVVKIEESSGSGDDDAKSQSGYTVSVERTFLPEFPVNEYGISLRAMRCLEITESVCQLRDLIDLSMRDKLGPIDSLRKFATQYREIQWAHRERNGFQPRITECSQRRLGAQTRNSVLVPSLKPHAFRTSHTLSESDIVISLNNVAHRSAKNRRRARVVWHILHLCRHPPLLRRRTSGAWQCALHRRYCAPHRTSKDFLLFREETKDSRNHLLFFGHVSCVLQMGRHRNACRSVWFPQLVRTDLVALPCFHWNRDFFPVILSFLRQLPIIGNVLSMPGVANVLDKLAGSQASLRHWEVRRQAST